MPTTDEIEGQARAAMNSPQPVDLLAFEQIRATLAVADAINALTKALVDSDGDLNVYVKGRISTDG